MSRANIAPVVGIWYVSHANRNTEGLITLEDDLLERFEDFRYGNRIPSRAEASEAIEGLKNRIPQTPPKKIIR
jgi:hypothetical protein